MRWGDVLQLVKNVLPLEFGDGELGDELANHLAELLAQFLQNGDRCVLHVRCLAFQRLCSNRNREGVLGAIGDNPRSS